MINFGYTKCLDQIKIWHTLAPAKNTNCILRSIFLVKKGQFLPIKAFAGCFVIANAIDCIAEFLGVALLHPCYPLV